MPYNVLILGSNYVLYCSLEGYIGIMERRARLLVEAMCWAADREYLNIQQALEDMTMDVVGQTAFGYFVLGYLLQKLDMHTGFTRNASDFSFLMFAS